MMKNPLGLILLLSCPALLSAGCNILNNEPVIDEVVVIAPKLVIRSSTAAVALDLMELKRGDRLEILDTAEVRTPTRVEEWYKVRTKDKNPVVGWVESRYVINQSIVKKLDDLFQITKDLPVQGRGRLKVQTKLRVEPAGDVVTLLSRGVMVDVVGKARTTVKQEKQQSPEDSDEPQEEPEAKTVLWLQIRLPDTEVLHSGWVGAQQVDLDVPEEILHLEGEGRRFTGWVAFEQVREKNGELKNNYIGLMKNIDSNDPVDFSRVWVLYYSFENHRYNGAYIESGLRGMLPVTLGTSTGHAGFKFNEIDNNGKSVLVEYEIIKRDPTKYEVRKLTPSSAIKTPRRRR